jgi:hypothetical protein
MASANKSIPFVVPPQALLRPEPVTQQILAFILTTRRQIVDLEKELGEAQAGVQEALQAGAEVEPGMFHASSLRVTDHYRHLIVTA